MPTGGLSPARSHEKLQDEISKKRAGFEVKLIAGTRGRLPNFTLLNTVDMPLDATSVVCLKCLRHIGLIGSSAGLE